MGRSRRGPCRRRRHLYPDGRGLVGSSRNCNKPACAGLGRGLRRPRRVRGCRNSYAAVCVHAHQGVTQRRNDSDDLVTMAETRGAAAVFNSATDLRTQSPSGPLTAHSFMAAQCPGRRGHSEHGPGHCPEGESSSLQTPAGSCQWRWQRRARRGHRAVPSRARDGQARQRCPRVDQGQPSGLVAHMGPDATS